MIGNEKEAVKRGEELQQLLQLEKNGVFVKYFQEPLAQAAEAMLDGATKRAEAGGTPATRAEFVEGYHLAVDFAGKLARLKAEWTKEIREWQGK